MSQSNILDYGFHLTFCFSAYNPSSIPYLPPPSEAASTVSHVRPRMFPAFWYVQYTYSVLEMEKENKYLPLSSWDSAFCRGTACQPSRANWFMQQDKGWKEILGLFLTSNVILKRTWPLHYCKEVSPSWVLRLSYGILFLV